MGHKLEPPTYLSEALRKRYVALAPQLTKLRGPSELDADFLARYVIAEANYLRVTSRLTAALNAGSLDAAVRLTGMQDKFFKQCRACGADLGMTQGWRGDCHSPPDVIDGEEVALFGS